MRDSNGRIIYGDVAIGRSIFDDRDLSGDTEAERNKQERHNQSSHMSRRVIEKLQREHKLCFVTDGSRLAFSAKRLEGFSLMYPKMPMVRVSKDEYFPIEFLFQAQGPAKQNNERIINFAHMFNDKYACSKRIEEITNLLTAEEIMRPLSEKLELLNLKLSTAPLHLRAVVLRPPRLVTNRNQDLEIRNGPGI